MRYNTIHADAAADPMRRPKTRRRSRTTPRWPSSLKKKVERHLPKSLKPTGGEVQDDKR